MVVGTGRATIFYSEHRIEGIRECVVVGPTTITELEFLMYSLQTKTCEDVVGRIMGWIWRVDRPIVRDHFLLFFFIDRNKTRSLVSPSKLFCQSDSDGGESSKLEI